MPRTTSTPSAPLPRERWTSDLNVHGGTPTRVQPKVGDYGPVGVPSTRRKKIMRVLAWVAFVAALAAVIGYGWWFYVQLSS